ncbi:hypothetical protein LOK49_LG03G03229 [Camellia lanceoleosa]|uniref:Uncharacterized protein n=1 Tax=Camellia lanceoleosa TaxID=1840588 RepID=A0ACC0I7A4_9ERIC|nr:hypothetical protein LOK49_LG03G03229 [Camellia lanceoleosa]
MSEIAITFCDNSDCLTENQPPNSYKSPLSNLIQNLLSVNLFEGWDSGDDRRLGERGKGGEGCFLSVSSAVNDKIIGEYEKLMVVELTSFISTPPFSQSRTD